MSVFAAEDAANEEESREASTGVFEPGATSSDGSLARKEAAALASNEDLGNDGKKKEHNRHQLFQEHANVVALGLLWTVAIFTLIGMAIYVFHLLAPESWCWIRQEGLDKIRGLLTGVLFSSAMTGYVNKRMSS